MTAQELVGYGFDIVGSSGADTLSGTNVVDCMNGGAGNEIAAQSVRPWVFKCSAANDAEGRMAA